MLKLLLFKIIFFLLLLLIVVHQDMDKYLPLYYYLMKHKVLRYWLDR